MKKEFVMRGKTASTEDEILNFSGYKPGYAYKLVEFQIYPSLAIGSSDNEMAAALTAGKTAVNPAEPDFDDEGLIGVTFLTKGNSINTPTIPVTIINDTFLITQNLIISVINTEAGTPVNWQCRFESVKMSGPEEAATNYKQYAISDE